MATNEPKPVSRADSPDCVVCGGWPSTLRPSMRTAVNVLPLQGLVCDRCFQAFWANITAAAKAKRPKPP